ncbi:hypothetical protein GH714_001498 [Hevea brasiliensis]|uniref:non-specific serine/threonine protein kinase n=1 Tax=Hevea brasiliensis TaxID=3981 RepID=A0A6A6M6J0_HEVBR|nr:hypothetical protein GH714_001498 [Hevea brasiliensis]
MIGFSTKLLALPSKAITCRGERSLNLDWPTRCYEICLGVARDLAYLHEESSLRIVHKDVKASNIVLDSHLISKISDFGLAKLYDDTKTHISTRVAGTCKIIVMRGDLAEKAGVFAIGVVALEVMSGRPNSDSTLEEDKLYLLRPSMSRAVAMVSGDIEVSSVTSMPGYILD